MKPKRKPQTHYFEKGFIKFNQQGDVLKYIIRYYPTKNLVGDIEKGIVKDQQMLNKLLACKTIADVYKLHSFEKVIQN